MDERLKFLFLYMVFFFLWTCVALSLSKALKWVGKNCFGLSVSAQSKKASLSEKLKGYLAFQLILIFSVILSKKAFMFLIISFFSIALLEFIYQMVKSRLGTIQKIVSIMSGIIVTGVTAFSFIYLNSLIHYEILISILFILSVSDSFSQVVGESLKGPRLFPKISPGKTWSGLIGGFLFANIGAFSFYYVFKSDLSVKFILFTTCIIFICGFIGDTGASGLKRIIGIKDFSNIMGVQGGMLDRIDSMIFLGPVASILFTFYGV